jgi:hypothetical protein
MSLIWSATDDSDIATGDLHVRESSSGLKLDRGAFAV